MAGARFLSGSLRAVPLRFCLLCLFAGLSWSAVTRESPTYDETLHSVAAWTAIKLHDYRMNVEHPVLWKYWAALPQAFTDAFHLDTTTDAWKRVPRSRRQETEVWRVGLFETPGNGTDQLFATSRFMMMLLGVALGALIGWWASRLGGAVAATIAVAFYALDPNFLGHAPLITNDVAMSLVFFALVCAVWRTGQVSSWPRVLLLAVLCGAAVTTKYSALAFGPIVALLLLIRASLDRPWVMFGEAITSRLSRALRVVLISAVCAVVSFGAIWASYGFRFTVSSDPNLHLDLDRERTMEAAYSLAAEQAGVRPTAEQVAAFPPSLFMRTMSALADHRLLPEPYLDGLMYVHANAIVRRTFLFGKVSLVGSWVYFPVAMLAKTPTGTILAVLLALMVLAAWHPWAALRAGSARTWDLCCVALPPVIYMALAVTSRLNIGLRHVFPVYPFLFLGVGVAGARMLMLYPRPAAGVIAGLACALVVESIAAFPNYISFFNAPAGGARGGLRLLGDSNLDWGQGLKLIHEWQLAHPEKRLALSYFGSASPAFYGVDAVPASQETRNGVEFKIDSGTDVTAISASMLQGIELDPESRKRMAIVRETQTPIEVLGGSIYLFQTASIVAELGTAQ